MVIRNCTTLQERACKEAEGYIRGGASGSSSSFTTYTEGARIPMRVGAIILVVRERRGDIETERQRERGTS